MKGTLLSIIRIIHLIPGKKKPNHFIYFYFNKLNYFKFSSIQLYIYSLLQSKLALMTFEKRGDERWEGEERRGHATILNYIRSMIQVSDMPLNIQVKWLTYIRSRPHKIILLSCTNLNWFPHCAWPLWFAHSLTGFEVHLIRWFLHCHALCFTLTSCNPLLHTTLVITFTKGEGHHQYELQGSRCTHNGVGMSVNNHILVCYEIPTAQQRNQK